MTRAFSFWSPLLVAALLAGCAQEARRAETADSKPVQAAASPSAAPEKPAKPAQDPHFAAKGMYVTATSVALPRFKTLIASLKAAGGNTIVIDAKDETGLVMYPSEVPLAKAIKATREAPIKNLKEKLDYAHAQGIHVIARVCCFQDPVLAKARPDLCPRDVNGGIWKEVGRQVWVDPSKPEAQQYFIGLAKELIAQGVDEIQWDYVRFPAMGKTQNARYAFDMKAHEKHEIITGFVKTAYEELHPTGALLSADVYGIMAWAHDIDVKITGQQLEDMANYVDVLSPMVYPSHFSAGFAGFKNPADAPYHFVNKGVSLLQKKVEKTDVVIRPWLQAMPYRVSHFTPTYISEQIRAAKDAKAIGWLMWNAQNQYDTAWAGAKAASKRGM